MVQVQRTDAETPIRTFDRRGENLGRNANMNGFRFPAVHNESVRVQFSSIARLGNLRYPGCFLGQKLMRNRTMSGIDWASLTANERLLAE